MWKRWYSALPRLFFLRKHESTDAIVPFRKHIEDVRAFAQSRPPMNALAFAVATAERQFLLFARFCEPRHRPDADIVRQTLDALWAWVRESTPLTTSTTANLAALFPVDEECDDWPYGFALEYLSSLELMLQATERYDAEAIISMADNATNGIDYILQETSDVPLDTSAWFAQELFVVELSRKREDLAMVQNSLTPRLVDELRQRSHGVSITGNLAFSPEEL